jgi:hypothetical protein
MKSDTLIKSEGFSALFEKLGVVDAERFLMLISRERQGFDYTEWRRRLWADRSIDDLAALALSLEKQALARNQRQTRQPPAKE